MVGGLEQQEYQRMGNEMKKENETCFAILYIFFTKSVHETIMYCIA